MYNFTVKRYENALYDFVVHIEFNAAVFCEERKQIVDVVCEEPGRAGGKLTGDILDTFDNDVVFDVADTGEVIAQLPPWSMEISIIAEPGFMEATISSVRSVGASCP